MEHFQAQSTWITSPWYQKGQRYHKKRKLQANIIDEHRHRKPQQTLKTKSSNTLKESYALIKWDLSQECQNSSLYTNQPMWPTTLTNGRIWSYQ